MGGGRAIGVSFLFGSFLFGQAKRKELGPRQRLETALKLARARKSKSPSPPPLSRKRERGQRAPQAHNHHPFRYLRSSIANTARKPIASPPRGRPGRSPSFHA